jgi:hypothetical protein
MSKRNYTMTPSQVRVCTDDDVVTELHDELCKSSNQDPEAIVQQANALGNNVAMEIHRSRKVPGMYVAFVYHTEASGCPGWIGFVFEGTTMEDVRGFLEEINERTNEASPYPYHFSRN